MRYDPETPPNPRTWLSAPEADRLDAVRRHHRRAKERAGSPEVHAIIHVAVETQLAEAHPAATAAMGRLLSDGLSRHEALHAVGSVLAEEIFGVMKHGKQHDAAGYARELEGLTASSWRAKY